MLHRCCVMVVVAIIVGLVSIGAGSQAFAGGTTYYFPHVADGRADPIYYMNEFFFNNTQATSTTVTLKFFSDNGSPWTVDLRSLDRVEAGGNRDSTTFTLQPYETVNLNTGSTGMLKVGWATVECSQPLVASSSFTMFRMGSPPQILWQASVLPSPPATQVSCPANISRQRDVFEGIGADTGFAIANPSGSDATVTVTVMARWGAPPAAVKNLNVPKGGHVAMFLSELFIESYWGDTFHGTARFSSNVAVSMVALKRSYGGNNDIYSAIPVQPEAELKHHIVWDTESNSSISLAQQIDVPVEIIGTSNFSDDTSDSDYFTLNLLAGQTVFAFLLADTVGSPLDDALVLYDPLRIQVASTDNTYASLRDPFLSYTVSNSGNYVLKCGSVTGASSRGAFYRLFVQVK